MKKNRYTVPYVVWDSAICDFDKAYKTYLTKIEKNKQEGKEDDPSNKCKFKFRSKQGPQQSIKVRHRDFNANNSVYRFLLR